MPEEAPDLWTQFLELVESIIVPVWNDLIQYTPLLLVGLFVAVLALIVRSWRKSGARNRSRVTARRPGRVPEGIHMPGPSPWPFVAPVGLFLIFASLVGGGGGLPFYLPLFLPGLAIAAVGVTGWYLDAGREWRRAEAGDHGAHTTAITAGAMPQIPAWAMEPPPGIHMPGPSPWPFFAPIGMAFVFLGLIFGPFLIVGGILMALIAVAGWYRDAGREYRAIEAGHHPEPDSRDPARAVPNVLPPIYATIAVVAIALTLSPVFFGLFPGSAAGGAGEPAESPDPAPEIGAASATSFTVTQVVVPADTPIELTFDNQQDGVPHNVTITDGGSGAPVFATETFPGVETRTYQVPPLAAGEYTFMCTVHPPMTGTLVSR